MRMAPYLDTPDAGLMCKDGFQFTAADKGVWLVNAVPARYISVVRDWA